MSVKFRSALLLVPLLLSLLIWPATSQAASDCAPDGVQNSGAVYRICMPAPGQWNGELVIYAHGYVAFNKPIEIPENQLSLGTGPSIPEIVNGLNYAFAATSYSTNGLAIKEGVADVLDLIDVFTRDVGAPQRVYVVGPSEGGIITALILEQNPDKFVGGVSACGPVGDFPSQINYWGDVRVLFDHYYPGILPGSPVQVPPFVIQNWENYYDARIRAQLLATPSTRDEFMKVARIPMASDSATNIDSIMNLLWYNVFATNDGVLKLNGQPFDNSRRFYTGSDNDILLNLQVERFRADADAVNEMQNFYQTTGDIQVPMVMLHTIDEIIPYWHEVLYSFKVAGKGQQANHTNLPILWRYGHCNFTPVQLLIAFVIAIQQATDVTVTGAEQLLPDPEQQREYLELFDTYVESPKEESQLFIPQIFR